MSEKENQNWKNPKKKKSNIFKRRNQIYLKECFVNIYTEMEYLVHSQMKVVIIMQYTPALSVDIVI